MTEFFEIDFLDVQADGSGDAIVLRYGDDRGSVIHVVDGGYQQTGETLVSFIRQHYNNPSFIDHVVVTHPDGDHAGGLRSVLEEFTVGTLWMLRPWSYAHELVGYFDNVTSVEWLERELRNVFPNLAALEDIAIERAIEIREPFQGQQIGWFTALAPTRLRWLELILASDKTPISSHGVRYSSALRRFSNAVSDVLNQIRSAWGEEVFSPEETAPENDMSVVQYAYIADQRILLTGDAGREALSEAADYLEANSVILPGIDRFQVPHHGSRRNVSTEVLDRLLGPRLNEQPNEGTFTAIVSASKNDPKHPRNAVVRAMIHRGGRVTATQGQHIRTHQNAGSREGWVALTPLPYPETQEEA